MDVQWHAKSSRVATGRETESTRSPPPMRNRPVSCPQARWLSTDSPSVARQPTRARHRGHMRLTPLLLLFLLLIPVRTAGADPSPPTPAPVGSFFWPLAPPHPVLRPFQPPAAPWGPGHRGVDLGGQAGDAVLAVADGTVVFAGQLVDRPVISVDHADGLRSTYEPVDPAVSTGQAVHRGDLLGHLLPGHPECTGAPACLHWGIKRGNEYLDPLVLVSATRHVRLLPWPGGERARG